MVSTWIHRRKYNIYVRYEVLTELKMLTAVFWDMMSNLVGGYQDFEWILKMEAIYTSETFVTTYEIT
jgi:nitrate/nitrite-specific signal transduction histidine kinase